MKFLPLAFLLVCANASVAHAQDSDPTMQERAFAAGYVAQFTCSATFNGKKDLDAIRRDELSNTYPVYEALFDDVGEPVIDRAKGIVSVRYSDSMPPRISAHRPQLGCVALPIGASAGMVKALPRVSVAAPERGRDTPWPKGDRLPNSRPVSASQLSALDTVIGTAMSGGFNGDSSAVLVLKDGDIVGERYRDGFTKDTSQRTWSVAKSIAATVIGSAVQDGLIDVDDPAGLAAWARPGDPRAAITVEHLLHMSSGLNSDPAGNRTDDVYVGGGLVAQHATAASLDVRPGTRWRYANNDTMLAMRALREAMDNDDAYRDYPFTAVLHPLGMLDTWVETDWDGDFILSSQVWTTARDLGRLGLLYLNDGVWNGERILPEGWADYAAALAPAQPWGDAKEPEDGHRGYGAQFWRYLDYPGVPNDTYAALGNRGQFLIIVPSRDVVIVRRGYDYRGNYFDGPGFAAAVLEALE